MKSPQQPDPSGDSDPPGDPFAPPEVPITVFCLHCGEEYESWQILWRPDAHSLNGGDWCCPTDGCEGVGFGFDIFPSDRDWQDEHGNGWHCCDDDEDFDFDGTVDHAVLDQFWREDPTALLPDCASDELSIAVDADDDPLERLLPPEERPLRMSDDDIPF